MAGTGEAFLSKLASTSGTSLWTFGICVSSSETHVHIHIYFNLISSCRICQRYTTFIPFFKRKTHFEIIQVEIKLPRTQTSEKRMVGGGHLLCIFSMLWIWIQRMKRKGRTSVRRFPGVKRAENFAEVARIFRTEISNYKTWSYLLDCKETFFALCFLKVTEVCEWVYLCTK